MFSVFYIFVFQRVLGDLCLMAAWVSTAFIASVQTFISKGSLLPALVAFIAVASSLALEQASAKLSSAPLDPSLDFPAFYDKYSYLIWSSIF